ncbi:MAG: cytochrome P450 [Halieaceae bacterium]|uniref:cytochrome P450 n=1 Tax=Haliea alexandrii TaxID=2448162 RepID=UPI000F0B359A|nr:cytochrome P450 [Haliea alexandrii]MCR9183903.1 cytochrome P450 [Halieaceae bacterium]
MYTEFPFLSAEYAAHPQPFWEKLRDSDPVHYAKDYGFWVISRHRDILEMLKDPHTYSSAGGPGGGLTAGNDGAPEKDNGGIGFLPMIQNDPPEHTRVRSIFANAFTPKRIAEMEPTVVAIANNLLAEIHEKIRDGRDLDLVDDFASPLPVYVIAQMMGIPLSERHKLRMWSDSLAIGADEAYTLEQKLGSRKQMTATLSAIISKARDKPQGDTLISAMLNASEKGENLHPGEILGLSKLLWLAGNETTTNLISNGTVFLLNNTEVLEELRRDKKLIPEFVEEMLRFNGPVMGLFRNATRDVEFRGKAIRKGDTLWLLFSSGNLDSRAYDAPERFDLHRRNRNHLALGKGVHFCMGSALARLEARVAFETIVDLIPYMKLSFENGKRIPVPVLSGWIKLPMSISRNAIEGAP